MAVEDPCGISVVCDECGEETTMDTTEYVGNPKTFGVSEETIEENGWLLVDGQTYCPKCRKEYE